MMDIMKPGSHLISRGLAMVCGTLLLAGCGMAGSSGSVASATQYQAAGKYRAAHIEATKILQKDPKNGAAWLVLGQSTLMLGNPDTAMSNLEKAKANGVPKSRWVVPVGRALLVMRQNDKLLETVTPDRSFTPALQARVAVLRGDALRAEQRHDQAKRSYRAALKLQPEDPLALIGLARLAADKQHLDVADRYLQQALKAAPNHSVVWVAKGDIAYKAHKLTDAATAYSKALDLKTPGWLPQGGFYARLRLANVQAQQHQYHEALANIQKLEKLASSQPYPHYLHAVVLYRQGHLDEAIDQLQLVLKVRPNSVQAQALMGAVNYAKGNYSQAEMYLSNAIGTDPNNKEARKLLALTYYREGRTDQAFRMMRTLLPKRATDAQLLALLQRATAAGVGKSQAEGSPDRAGVGASGGRFARARQDLAEGQPDDAIHRLQAQTTHSADAEAQRITLLVMAYAANKHSSKAVQTAGEYVTRHPQSSAAHLLYGTALVADGKRTQARAQYKKACKLDAKNTAALLSLGSLDVVEGRLEDAVARYQKVLEIDPHNARAMTAMGNIAKARNNPGKAIKLYQQAMAAAPEYPNAYFALITLYSQSRQFDQAADVATKLAAARPYDAIALNALGSTELNAGHQDKALKPLQEAVRIAPAVPLYRTNLARAQIANRNTEAALGNLQTVVKNHPERVRAVSLLAFVKLRGHDESGAIALAHSLQERAHTRAAGFMLEGDLYMASKAYDKAVRAYRRGLKVHYDRPAVVKTFLALDRSGARDPASLLRDWLAKHPKDAAMQLQLGQYYLEHGRLSESKAQYQKVLKAYPSNILALNNLAWIYSSQDSPKALVIAKRAYRLAPASASVQDTYGWSLVLAKQPKAALPILTRAAKAEPGAAIIHYHLAVAQARSGDHAAARTTLENLQKAGAQFPDKRAAQNLYRQLSASAGGHH